MEGERCVFNVGCGSPVVVDDRHLVAGSQQFFRFGLFGAVGVHHHKKGAAVCREDGILTADESVCVSGQLLQSADELLG